MLCLIRYIRDHILAILISIRADLCRSTPLHGLYQIPREVVAALEHDDTTLSWADYSQSAQVQTPYGYIVRSDTFRHVHRPESN